MYLVVLGLGLLTSCLVLAYFLKHQAFSLFHPLTYYTAFHMIIFVIRPIFAYFLDYSTLYQAYNFTPTMADKITVILAANIGYLSFAFFVLRAGNIAVSFRADISTIEERRRLAQIFPWVIAICAPLALYSLSTNFSVTNNIYDGVVLDQATGVFINTKGNGYLTDGQLMLAPICAIIAWLGRFRWLSLLPMVGFVILRGGIGSRGPFIAALVMLLLLYLYEKRVRYPKLQVLLAIVAIATLFNFVGADRGAAIRQAVGLEDKETVFTENDRDEKFLETMDLANLEFFEYVVWVVPQRSGTYDYFLNNLQLFTEPIPRVLWKSKPAGAPIQPVRLWDYGSPIGMTYSLPGLGWMSMGWLGVIIWCGLWGHILGALYRRYWQGDQSTIKTAAYMIFVATLVLAYRDGSSVSLAKQSGAYLAPVLVWYVIGRYLGLPRLSEMRLSAMDKSRQLAQAISASAKGLSGTEPSGPPRQTAPVMKEPDLPPAVIRRRLALKGGPGAPTKG